MRIKEYDREKALEYARLWALRRNPRYYNYHLIGGDCTNFASQCLFSGTGVMNYLPLHGWYYIDPNRKSASWTGVQYYYNFLTENEGIGPFGTECEMEDLIPGDFIQLGNREKFYHTLIVVRIEQIKDIDNIFIATHSYDSYDRALNTYNYYRARYIHIEGYRAYI